MAVILFYRAWLNSLMAPLGKWVKEKHREDEVKINRLQANLKGMM